MTAATCLRAWIGGQAPLCSSSGWISPLSVCRLPPQHGREVGSCWLVACPAPAPCRLDGGPERGCLCCERTWLAQGPAKPLQGNSFVSVLHLSIQCSAASSLCAGLSLVGGCPACCCPSLSPLFSWFLSLGSGPLCAVRGECSVCLMQPAVGWNGLSLQRGCQLPHEAGPSGSLHQR